MYDIIIIGAGLSGITAADYLLKYNNNYKILLLEARDRLGGRTETIKYNNISMDLGGQWISDKHTNILKYIKKFSLKLIDQYYDESMESNLVECIGYKNPKLEKKVKEEIDIFFKIISKLSNTIDLNKPWEHKYAKYWDIVSVKEYINLNIINIKAKKEIKLFIQTVFACDIKDISFLYFLFYIKSGGGIKSLGDGKNSSQKWTIQGGMQQLSKLILDNIKKNIVIYFNSPVIKIEKNTVYTPTQIFNFKKIIFALSPPLITSIQFNPPLPQYKINLCSSYISGNAIKIIIIYKKAFWSQFMGDKRNNNNFFYEYGPVHNIFQQDNNILIGFITCSYAHIFKTLPYLQRKQIVLNQLYNMYRSKQVFDPILYIDKIWPNEKYSKGCFSNIYKANGTFYKYGKYIRSPIGNFHWASSETSNEFCGYLEGAVRSGIRVAREIHALF